jgi:hypothetical protein
MLSDGLDDESPYRTQCLLDNPVYISTCLWMQAQTMAALGTSQGQDDCGLL